MKQILLLLLFLAILPIAFAQEQHMGRYEPGTCVMLTQTCGNCTLVKITSITRGSINSTILLGETAMAKNGTEYSYRFCDTQRVGNYIVRGVGDPDGYSVVYSFDFDIGSNSLALLLILGITALIFIGMEMMLDTTYLGFIGGLLLALLGVYTMLYGFADTTNIYTNGFAISILGVGIMFIIIAAYDWSGWGENNNEGEE